MSQINSRPDNTVVLVRLGAPCAIAKPEVAEATSAYGKDLLMRLSIGMFLT
jgi:hypothetical protein